MLSPDVAKAADLLLETLRQTDAFKRYQALRESVMADEVNRRLIERFTRAQSALQLCAMSGGEAREEDASEFEKLSALLYQSDELTDYLLSQMRVQQLVAETMDRLTREVGLDVALPEL